MPTLPQIREVSIKAVTAILAERQLYNKGSMSVQNFATEAGYAAASEYGLSQMIEPWLSQLEMTPYLKRRMASVLANLAARWIWRTLQNQSPPNVMESLMVAMAGEFGGEFVDNTVFGRTADDTA